ncbi:MAG: zf-HC2 domain-containing protein [Thermoanaerobaculia bacterium]|nr:zf-HC2 domain-containing protein [Thermoanaerobaculia bacterium]
MQCDDLLLLINDYVDGDVDPAICAELEGHLDGCNPCQIVVDNIRKTIALYRGEEVFELPLELRERLCQRLRERWDARRAECDEPIG